MGQDVGIDRDTDMDEVRDEAVEDTDEAVGEVEEEAAEAEAGQVRPLHRRRSCTRRVESITHASLSGVRAGGR